MFRSLFAAFLIAFSYASASAAAPNILLICVDDLRPELNCFAVDYIHSPNIDRLAAEGRSFSRHYVQAPTCGVSRYSLLTGRYGNYNYGNHLLAERAKRIKRGEEVPASMPAYFRERGYRTVSIGKVSHYPGGLGGEAWNDRSQVEMPNSWDEQLMPCGAWETPQGAMHGLAHGQTRQDQPKKSMPVFQSEEGPDDIYPDGVMIEGALKKMEELSAGDEPFFFAVGIIRPHLPFGAPAKYMEPYRHIKLPAIPHPEKPDFPTTWHRSGEFNRYQLWGKNPNQDQEFADEVRKHYAACVTYADALVGRLLKKLEAGGKSENTIVVLWGDHGWHLGEHAVWGKHTLFEESLRSPLIIRVPGMDRPGEMSGSIVETIDIFPTLADLSDLPQPEYIDGVSLRPILADPTAPGHPAVSYTKAKTIRTDRWRMIRHANGYVELYDHETDSGETVNAADEHPEHVADLMQLLEKRLGL
ncbi:sulfatase [Stratiformator vulcanicus]|uniref:Choline-sulfatase n=1 Tax=Stratiformator vulcanicus TaxID=2527980 RepID=A0A517R7H9_9PLAN|nr:sulfatase [Stratiformator vulcanicus]QDT39844.1 Choline-sulfatase [Stratiformator vulcanicus]